jgi:hypothetical protein
MGRCEPPRVCRHCGSNQPRAQPGAERPASTTRRRRRACMPRQVAHLADADVWLHPPRQPLEGILQLMC